MTLSAIYRTFIWLTIFSVAMAFLETSVAIYLRKIYYPEGFIFPLKIMEKNILIVEVLREFATLVMLLGAGFIAGRSRTEKFGLFLYSFAVWDIFYYIFLKVILNWPSSLLTWDILFLIPTVWVGPVVAPVLVSITMIVLAFLISKSTSNNMQTRILPIEWLIFTTGSVVLIIGFIYDYVRFMLQFFSLLEIFSPSNGSKLMEEALKYVPCSFPWGIFAIGLGIIIAGIFHFSLRNKIASKVSSVVQP